MTDAPHLRTRADGGRAVEYPPAPEPLAVPVYDNHTHLEIADGALPLDVHEHLERAASVGVAGAVQVGTDVATSRWSADAAAREPRLLAAVALHPNEAPGLEASGALDDALAAIDELAARPRVRAIGETGLDFFRTDEVGRPAQFRSFEAHIDIAKRHGLALQIHDRDAHDDVVATLRRVTAPERTVFHCFSGGDDLARLAADEGWYCSFAGNITFKNAENLREALRGAAGRPHPRGDRCAVPHSGATARSPERAVPRAAHGAVHGRGARSRSRRVLRTARVEHGVGVRVVAG